MKASSYALIRGLEILMRFLLYHAAACFLTGVTEKQLNRVLFLSLLLVPLSLYNLVRERVRRLLPFLVLHIMVFLGMLYAGMWMDTEIFTAFLISGAMILIQSVSYRLSERYTYERILYSEKPSVIACVFFVVMSVISLLLERPFVAELCFYEMLVFLMLYMVHMNIYSTERFLYLNKEAANLPSAQLRGINRILVIPMFNFFGGFIANFGIVILLMTLVIKLLLFPLTYKSYMSSAKMRVLKPEIEKATEKIPANKMQERQKITMELYRKVGVNPMGGCLPMLLQMPILIAIFSFFPSAIELRQQSFLWADDLSTYDAIISWNNFSIPFIGSHLSLFCLLMTIVNVIYTKINMATQDMGNQQMPGMKYIMYFMPVMFLFIFNSYPSGLSYYYLVATLITIIQTYAIRATVDEEKLLKQLHENKNKPKKTSGAIWTVGAVGMIHWASGGAIFQV